MKLRLVLALMVLFAWFAPVVAHNRGESAARTMPFELPVPSGPDAVGTTSWPVVDESRRETFAGGSQPRQVEVRAWYPAAARGRGPTAPYLREGLTEVRSFASLFKADAAFDQLADVHTHAEMDALPRASGGRFPVLVFSHGFTGAPSAYTALLEDLASHGYAVLSIVHPYEATAAMLDGGRVVSMLNAAGGFLPDIQAVFDEWGPEDATMTAVTGASSDAEQLRLLRGYLSKIPRTDITLRRWVADTKLVIDRLPRLAPASPAGRLAARLDMNRLGVLGHSMGGVTAGAFCAEDARCRAGLNLDGIPQYGSMIDRTMKAAFLMVYSARPGRLGAVDAIYRHAASRYYRVDVADTRHLDFSDMTFWGGPLRDRPVLGSIAPGRVTEITRAIVREYFDQELLGRPSSLLAKKSGFPEVTVR